MRYRVIADLAICKVAGERLPLWALAVVADPATRFVQLLRSPGEITVVCPRESIPATESGVEAHGGYVALQLEGPFPLDAVGILKAFIAPLAEAKVPIFAISSFETDFVLIEAGRSKEAMEKLTVAGCEHVEG
jgi:uncharacterized protein